MGMRRPPDVENRDMNPIRCLGKLVYGRSLEEKGPSLTFARLCTSRHLEDLQWVASFAIMAILVAVVVVVIIIVPQVFHTI